MASTPTHPQIHTYHCLCSTLLLASTHTLPTLPRRAAPSLDAAIILPVPPLPSPQEPSRPPSPSPSQSAGGIDPNSDDTKEPSEAQAVPLPQTLPHEGYTVLLPSLLPSPGAPILIRRSDGFEKRRLLRCGRCRLVVGYELEGANAVSSAGETAVSSAGETSADEKMRIVYILPGGMMSTEAMNAGRKVEEGMVRLEGAGRGIVTAAAFE